MVNYISILYTDNFSYDIIGVHIGDGTDEILDTMANKGMIQIENISQLNEMNKDVADVIAVMDDPNKSKITTITPGPDEYLSYTKYTKFNIFLATVGKLLSDIWR